MERSAEQNRRQHKRNVEYLTILRAREAVSSLLSQRTEDILDAVRPGYILERRVFKAIAGVKVLGELRGNVREAALRNYDLLLYITQMQGINDLLRRGVEIPLLSRVRTRVGPEMHDIGFALAAEYLGSEAVGMAILSTRRKLLGLKRERVERDMVSREWLDSLLVPGQKVFTRQTIGDILADNLANASCESLIREVGRKINSLKLPGQK